MLVCAIVRVIGGAVALLRSDADVNAWHEQGALDTHVLCMGHLGCTHCCYSAADGGALGFSPYSSPALVCNIVTLTDALLFAECVTSLYNVYMARIINGDWGTSIVAICIVCLSLCVSHINIQN